MALLSTNALRRLKHIDLPCSRRAPSQSHSLQLYLLPRFNTYPTRPRLSNGTGRLSPSATSDREALLSHCFQASRHRFRLFSTFSLGGRYVTPPGDENDVKSAYSDNHETQSSHRKGHGATREAIVVCVGCAWGWFHAKL